MSKVIRITIQTEPTPKGRPKTTLRHGRVWTYTPRHTEIAEDFIKLRVMRHRDECFAEHIPVKMSVVFYRTKSKYLPKTETLPVRKPDSDNLCKLVSDAINGILIKDDAQLTTVHIRKRWSTTGIGYITLRLEDDTLDTPDND